MPEDEDTGLTAQPGPTFAAGTSSPRKRLPWWPRPDRTGPLAVEQTLIFDAGAGLDRSVTLWYSVAPRSAGSRRRQLKSQYGVVPVVTDLEAREIGGLDLTVRVTEQTDRNPLAAGRRYELVPSIPWSPGRHAVVINYRLGDVWVEADGANALVLPLQLRGRPGWLPAGRSGPDPGSWGDPHWSALRPISTSTHAAECGSREFFAYHDREYSSVSALVVTDPPGVTAQPIPITERET